MANTPTVDMILEAELEAAEAKLKAALLATWSASCSTDGYIDLRPYWKAEEEARAKHVEACEAAGIKPYTVRML